MKYSLMSNKQIMESMAESIEQKRVMKPISAKDMAKKGGYNAQTFSNFLNQGTNIRLETLIDIFRGLGELDKLQKVFEIDEQFSPTGRNKKVAKRVFAKKKPSRAIIWNEDKGNNK